MNIEKYQRFTKSTAKYPKDQELLYLMLGLTSEVGEVADKLKKHIRDGEKGHPMTEEQIKSIQLEFGDILWYLARLSDHFGFSLKETLQLNVKKLTDRHNRNKIKGSGDNR